MVVVVVVIVVMAQESCGDAGKMTIKTTLIAVQLPQLALLSPRFLKFNRNTSRLFHQGDLYPQALLLSLWLLTF